MSVEKAILIVPKSRAKALLEKQIKQGQTLLAKTEAVAGDIWADSKHEKQLLQMCRNWSLSNDEILQQSFAGNFATHEYGMHRGALYLCDATTLTLHVESAIRCLRDITVRIRHIPEAIPHGKSHQKMRTTEVFVVHGRDEGVREEVARFLEKLSLKPIVLAEQPSEGQTIIEKFERHAACVGFAVVLMTPDDVAAPGATRGKPKPRARQNVVFELGYFVAKLGRKRVCALLKGNVEVPSDYYGVVFVPHESDWKLSLAKELKAAGYSVDLNHVI